MAVTRGYKKPRGKRVKQAARTVSNQLFWTTYKQALEMVMRCKIYGINHHKKTVKKIVLRARANRPLYKEIREQEITARQIKLQFTRDVAGIGAAFKGTAEQLKTLIVTQNNLNTVLKNTKQG